MFVNGLLNLKNKERKKIQKNVFHSDLCFQACTVCWRSIWLTLSHPHLNQATQKKQSSICASPWKKHACLCAQMWVSSAGLLAETIFSELSEAHGIPSDYVGLLQPTYGPNDVSASSHDANPSAVQPSKQYVALLESPTPRNTIGILDKTDASSCGASQWH